MHQISTDSSFTLKGTLQAVNYFEIKKFCLNEIRQQLEQHINTAPKLLNNALIILDFTKYQIDINGQQFTELINLLNQYKMQIIGFSGTTQQQTDIIKTINNLPFIDKNKRKTSKLKTEPNYKVTNKTCIGPIRSGQQIQNLKGDIIIIGSVNSGAEIIAAGSVHIYGKLSGKCIAGYNNNKNAMIFCQSLNAELISIAGIYKKSTQIKTSNNMSIIYLDKTNQLIISNH